MERFENALKFAKILNKNKRISFVHFRAIVQRNRDGNARFTTGQLKPLYEH